MNVQTLKHVRLNSEARYFVVCDTLEHLMRCVNEARDQGMKPRYFTGQTPSEERAGIIASFTPGVVLCTTRQLAYAGSFRLPDADCESVLVTFGRIDLIIQNLRARFSMSSPVTHISFETYHGVQYV